MIQKRLVILGSETGVGFHMNLTKTYLILFTIPVCFALWKCANPVAPEGGPKDTRPPRTLNSNPPNFSTGFKANTIKIDFDEFVALKNATSEVNISPPLKSAPDLKLRGKSLIVKLDDSLAQNTTYSIDFGKCISDITENNVLTGYNYVFSTGNYVDSLSAKGVVLNSFDLTPQKDVFVMLYIDRHDTIPFDSLPVKTKPYYVTKTNEKGEFLLKNLRPGAMKLVALNDLNSNLIFDQASEKVAFYDSLIHPSFIPKPVIDTTKKDSLHKKQILNDTIIKKKADQIKKKAPDTTRLNDSIKEKKPLYPNYTLFLFEDIDSTQRILKSSVQKKGLVLITFKFPVKNLNLKLLKPDTLQSWSLLEFSPKYDSLFLWITNPYIDSLILKVGQGDKVIDTLKIELIDKSEKSGSKKKGQRQVLGITNNMYGGFLNQFAGNVHLIFSYPLSSWELKRIRLIQNKDTICPKSYFADSLKRMLIIEAKWKEDKSYSVFIPDSVFSAINGLANDTIKLGFKTKQAREFGNFMLDLDITGNPGSYLIQLLTEKDVLVRELKANVSGKLKFEYLLPGKYRIKAVKDRNRNGRWDTGNFRKKIQPEEIFYLSKLIEIRANWDVEEKWVIAPAN
jgi:hypothetical protein